MFDVFDEIKKEDLNVYFELTTDGEGVKINVTNKSDSLIRLRQWFACIKYDGTIRFNPDFAKDCPGDVAKYFQFENGKIKVVKG